MALTVTHEGGDIYRVDVTGMLRVTEMTRGETVVAQGIEELGGIRLLVVLDGFEGWSPEDDWGGLQFYMQHGDQIERIAIAGDERWRGEALLFAAADLRRAPVKFFTHDVAGARAWLKQ